MGRVVPSPKHKSVADNRKSLKEVKAMVVVRAKKPQPKKERQYPCDESPHVCPYNSTSDSRCAYWCRLGVPDYNDNHDYHNGDNLTEED